MFERDVDICHETVRFWWNRFGPMFAGEIRKRRVHNQLHSNWRWHLDEVFVRINGEMHYLWRAVDHEGEVLEVFATKRRDRRAALKFLKRAMKRYGGPEVIVTDRVRARFVQKYTVRDGPLIRTALDSKPTRNLHISCSSASSDVRTGQSAQTPSSVSISVITRRKPRPIVGNLCVRSMSGPYPSSPGISNM